MMLQTFEDSNFKANQSTSKNLEIIQFNTARSKNIAATISNNSSSAQNLQRQSQYSNSMLRKRSLNNRQE